MSSQNDSKRDTSEGSLTRLKQRPPTIILHLYGSIFHVNQMHSVRDTPLTSRTALAMLEHDARSILRLPIEWQ